MHAVLGITLTIRTLGPAHACVKKDAERSTEDQHTPGCRNHKTQASSSGPWPQACWQGLCKAGHSLPSFDKVPDMSVCILWLQNASESHR